MSDFEIRDGMYDELKKAASALNEESDKLNAAFARLEDQLKALNFGVSTWLDIAKTKKDIRSIGYAKIAGKWGLAFRITPANDFKPEIWQLRDAPRFNRIEAVAHIPALLQEMVVRGTDFAEKLIQSAERVDKLVESLQPVEETAISNESSTEELFRLTIKKIPFAKAQVIRRCLDSGNYTEAKAIMAPYIDVPNPL